MAQNKLTQDQLYNFVKVKGSQVVTSFNHDPAKNANSVILKYGTGNTSDNADGKVQGGHLYYLDYGSGIWTKTAYDTEAEMGVGQLLGIALGKFPEYGGTPEEVGMLLRGVSTTAVLGPANAGRPLYGSLDGGGTVPGRLGVTAPSSGGNVVQRLGHSLGYQMTTFEGNTYAETIVLFTPDLSYTVV